METSTKLGRKSRERAEFGSRMGRRRDDFETAIRPYKKGSGMVFKQLTRLLAMRPTNIVAQMIIVSINGTQFYLKRATCIRIPLLSKLLTKPSRASRTSQPEDEEARNLSLYEKLHDGTVPKKMLQFSFEKNPVVFAAVVDFVQNHELHAPQIICPKLFARDLRFWGFDVDDLEPCCYARVLRCLYEQDKLREFHGFLKKSPETEDWMAASNVCCEETKESGDRSIRRILWHILEEPFSSAFARMYFVLLALSIFGSFLTAAVETMEVFREGPHNNSTKVPESVKLLAMTLNSVDEACIFFQSLDYALRLLVSAKPRRFFCDAINITDGLAVLAALCKLVVPLILQCNVTQFMDERCGPVVYPYLYVIYFLQLLRVLRVLRPLSQMMEFRLLFYTLKSSFSELLLVFMLLFLLAVIFSFSIYYLGDKTRIRTIPDAMWYSIITLTTVGYGDIVPEDWMSRMLGSAMAVFGVIMLTMTTPIFVSNFHTLYLNAVVGQPCTIRNLHQKLDKHIHQFSHGQNGGESEDHLVVPAPSEDKRPEKRGWGRVPDWCRRCCRKPWQTQVAPQGPPKDDSKHTSSSCQRSGVRKRTPAWKTSYTSQVKVSVTYVDDEVQPAPTDSGADTSSSTEHVHPPSKSDTETETETEEGKGKGKFATNAFYKKVLQQHQGMLQPRHRSWFENYNTTSGDESPPTEYKASSEEKKKKKMKMKTCNPPAPDEGNKLLMQLHPLSRIRLGSSPSLATQSADFMCIRDEEPRPVGKHPGEEQHKPSHKAVSSMDDSASSLRNRKAAPVKTFRWKGKPGEERKSEGVQNSSLEALSTCAGKPQSTQTPSFVHRPRERWVFSSESLPSVSVTLENAQSPSSVQRPCPKLVVISAESEPSLSLSASFEKKPDSAQTPGLVTGPCPKLVISTESEPSVPVEVSSDQSVHGGRKQ